MIAGRDVVGHRELCAHLAGFVSAKRERVQDALEPDLSCLIARNARRGHDDVLPERGDLRRYVEGWEPRRLENEDPSGQQQKDQQGGADREQGSAAPTVVFRLSQRCKHGGIGGGGRQRLRLHGDRGCRSRQSRFSGCNDRRWRRRRRPHHDRLVGGRLGRLQRRCQCGDERFARFPSRVWILGHAAQDHGVGARSDTLVDRARRGRCLVHVRVQDLEHAVLLKRE